MYLMELPLTELSKKSKYQAIPQLILGLGTILFIAIYLFFNKDLVLATKALVGCAFIALVVSLIFFRYTTKRKDWLILVATILFGAMTIYFDNDIFIKWRTTIINVVIALGLVGMFYLKKSPIKMIFEKPLELELPESEWLRTNLWWAAYMLMMALLNSIIVLLELSNDIWMTFKMIINPAITFILALTLIIYLVKKSKAYKIEKASIEQQKQEE